MSIPQSIADDITNNIDEYFSFHSYVKKDTIPLIYVEAWILYITPKKVVSTYMRRHPWDNTSNDIVHELEQLLGISKNYSNTVFFGAESRQKRKTISINIDSPVEARRIYNRVIQMANDNISFFDGISDNDNFYRKYNTVRPSINSIAGLSQVALE